VTHAGAHRDQARALALLQRYGHDTVSVQGLEPGYRYWFDDETDALIAFVDTGGAWVAAGGPITARERLARAAERFADDARAQARRACFFAAEQPLADAGLPAMRIGEQPVWRMAEWDDVLAGASSLRYQLRRARSKGVRVRRLAAAELAEGSATRAALDELGRAWQATHRMPPMHFLVQLEPFALAEQRVLYAAELDGKLVGLASALAIDARARIFVEALVRAPDAPNGTPEVLVDAIMRATSARELTLGLAPLAGDLARWLRLARWFGAPLYDFAGLRAFKAKLRPHAWEPVYLCTGPGGSPLVALRDSLRAFAGGSLLAFAARTLLR
jgi:lysylphosphatidylglycerol synthetase-like protein (DUF2156 family)